MKLQKTLKVKIGTLSKNKQNILDRIINKNTKAIIRAICSGEQASINNASNWICDPEPKAKKDYSVRNLKQNGGEFYGITN